MDSSGRGRLSLYRHSAHCTSAAALTLPICLCAAQLKAGDALVLPAYWYHQVESFAEPGRLNVAVNYWFQGHSLATRLYRTLRENVFINCTEPAKPGQLHPCRN